MKTSTFNRVLCVLVILWIGYSIVCAILATRENIYTKQGMPWYAVVWVAYSLGVIVWFLVMGSRNERKVYHLSDGMDNDCYHCIFYSPCDGVCKDADFCSKLSGIDYPDDVGDKNLM